ncbi:MAG: glycosyltransferase [Actinomycetota bacterium]
MAGWRPTSADVDALLREPVISVVILANDDSIAALDAALRLTRANSPRTEIVVVDNGRWPGVGEMLDTLDIEVVNAPQAVDAASAWVAGLRRASGELVVAMSADVELQPGWRSRIARELVEREAVIPVEAGGSGSTALGTWTAPRTCVAIRGDVLRDRGPFVVTETDPGWVVGTAAIVDRPRWRDEMRHELLYWAGRLLEVKSGLGPYARGFHSRLDPALEVVPLIADAVNPATCEPGRVSLLDVGSGPAPIVGRRCGDRVVDVTSLDPLAVEYGLLIEAAGIVPTIPVRPGQVETLLDDIGDERFDVVWMCNALDHSADAVGGVRNLVEAAKPGGAIILSHVENEGEHASYEGLHHWNITLDGDRPRIWWRGGEVWLDEWLGDSVTVETVARRDPTWIDVVLRRPVEVGLGTGPATPAASTASTSAGADSVISLADLAERVSAI